MGCVSFQKSKRQNFLEVLDKIELEHSYFFFDLFLDNGRRKSFGTIGSCFDILEDLIDLGRRKSRETIGSRFCLGIGKLVLES